MSKRWADIRRASRLTQPQRNEIDRLVAEDLKLIESIQQAVRLTGKSENEVAEAQQQADAKVTASGDESMFAEIRAYVEALGGELEVIAVFGDKSVRLRGI